MDATQAALHAYNELGHAGRMGVLLRCGGQKIPLVGAAIAGGFGAYALYNAERGHAEGRLTDTQIHAMRAALAPYVMTQAGSIVTGLAGEEAIDAGLVAAGVPAEYRLGTLREAIASGAQAAIDARDLSQRKAEIPQPTVDAFVAALRNDGANTPDAALNDYFTARDTALLEGREGRVQSATSMARFGHLPRSPVSPEEIAARISDAARTYLAYGGNIDTAMAALSDDPARTRVEGPIIDLINLTPAPQSQGLQYDPNNDHLRQLQVMRAQYADANDAMKPLLWEQMRVTAANYLGEGHSVRDALFAYFRTVPFYKSNVTIAQIVADAELSRVFDGSDGSRLDGRVSGREIGQTLASLGVYNPNIDANHDGEAELSEIQAVISNPAPFRGSSR